MNSILSRIRQWLTPIVYLTNNAISMAGVVLVTSAGVLWLSFFVTLWKGNVDNPYFGILLFMVLPGIFFAGLVLIPAGIYLNRNRIRAEKTFPPLDIHNVAFRRLLVFVGATTFVNLIIAGQFGYGTVTYMESVEFCGQTCHTVMTPEFTAYQNSPHARVECVKCHIGAGADWFVKSKLSGAGQVVAVALNNYPRPIPTPVHNLRPARETCETCHWPQKFGAEGLKISSKFADDETNTQTRSVLLVHIGGSNQSPGIHGAHQGPGVRMRYAPADEKRQTIPIVEYDKGDGKWIRFVAADVKPDQVAKYANPETMRTMDCMDCHNRPSHTFMLPERALDNAIAAGKVVQTLPFVKKTGLELLKATYATQTEGIAKIEEGLVGFYQQKYPDLYKSRRADIEKSAQAVSKIYASNVFPEMKIQWGSYPNNLGHNDFPGCFRCHDDNHATSAGLKITQDCNTCHNLLAMDEASPKILTDLGVIAEQKPVDTPAPSKPAGQ